MSAALVRSRICSRRILVGPEPKRPSAGSMFCGMVIVLMSLDYRKACVAQVNGRTALHCLDAGHPPGECVGTRLTTKNAWIVKVRQEIYEILWNLEITGVSEGRTAVCPACSMPKARM